MAQAADDDPGGQRGADRVPETRHEAGYRVEPHSPADAGNLDGLVEKAGELRERDEIRW